VIALYLWMRRSTVVASGDQSPPDVYLSSPIGILGANGEHVGRCSRFFDLVDCCTVTVFVLGRASPGICCGLIVGSKRHRHLQASSGFSSAFRPKALHRGYFFVRRRVVDIV